MSASTAAKADKPVMSLSPMKDPASRQPPPTRTGPLTAKTDGNTPTNATAKGSRRAQGWHSAIGGGGGGITGTGMSSTNTLGGTVGGSGIRETQSNLTHSRANSGMPRRSSVQFSEDALDNHNAPRVPSKPRLPNTNKDDAAFRQSMADFLNVMYGDRTTGGSSSGSGTAAAGGKEKSSGNAAPPLSASGKGKADGGAPSTSASGAAEGKGDLPRARRSGSPPLPPLSVKGPLVKGLTATGSRHSTSDRIDTLVDTLVRAYSRQAISSRGEIHGGSAADDDNPISYNRPRHQMYRRAVASPRLGRNGAGSGHSGADTNEVSLFVSQAIDSFIGPGGLRQQGLPSTRSVLSSLGVDKNIFGLMPFQTRSNMQDVDAVEDASDTKLEPMYVGEQALFKSVGTRPNMADISVSKSMRGMIPAPSELIDDGEGNQLGAGSRSSPQRRVSSGSGKNRLNNSSFSLDSGLTAGKRGSNNSQPGGFSGSRSGPRRSSAEGRSGNNKSVTRCMSLDSKALGTAAGGAGGNADEDDSWGDDTNVPALANNNTNANNSGGGAGRNGGAIVVSSARSLLDYSKSRHSAALEQALQELREEEQLKRDVVMAVERQLRGYIVSLESEERKKKRGLDSATTAQVTKSAANAGTGSTSRSTATGVSGRAPTSSPVRGPADNGKRGSVSAVSSVASPPMKNMVEFFEKSTKATPPPDAKKQTGA